MGKSSLNSKRVMPDYLALRAGFMTAVLATLNVAAAGPAAVFDLDGTASVPAFRAPYSNLASTQSKTNLLSFIDNLQLRTKLLDGVTDPDQIKAIVDKVYVLPLLAQRRQAFAVDIKAQAVGGVPTSIVVPSSGIAAENTQRVLINLHGGAPGGISGGLLDSVPIAALGRIKIVTVDWGVAPNARFPSAIEDVAKVYGALIKTHRPENIGLYGCSSGAFLTAEATAWFHAHGLPRPGAIAMTGGGGVADDRQGDSFYISAPLGGYTIGDVPPRMPGMEYMAGIDASGPVASPAYYDDVLRVFPPSLIITGTRDVLLSSSVYTHERLVDLGASSELHVYEGQQHCFTAFDLPEARQAWRVMVRFFETHLGARPL